MKIALSQLNVTVGELPTNQKKIIDYINKTADSGTKLLGLG